MSAARKGGQPRGEKIETAEDNKTEKIEEGRKFERRTKPEKQEIKQASSRR